MLRVNGWIWMDGRNYNSCNLDFKDMYASSWLMQMKPLNIQASCVHICTCVCERSAEQLLKVRYIPLYTWPLRASFQGPFSSFQNKSQQCPIFFKTLCGSCFSDPWLQVSEAGRKEYFLCRCSSAVIRPLYWKVMQWSFINGPASMFQLDDQTLKTVKTKQLKEAGWQFNKTTGCMKIKSHVFNHEHVLYKREQPRVTHSQLPE